MLEGLMLTVALVACAIVAVSFALFALDQTRDASKHSAARETVDDTLLRPFAWMADGSTSAWVPRGVPALLALLVYGLGLPLLARYTRGRA